MAEKYNYIQIMKADVRKYIEEEVTLSDYESREELEDFLNDNLWNYDSITGNASGSYTFCNATAKQYVLDNMNICLESLREFCTPNDTIATKFLKEDWEYFDVTIRCYLLGQAISETLNEIEQNENPWEA